MSRTFASPGHIALVKFIIKKREEAGLTQRDVAKKLRRHQSYVATYELGQKRIDVIEFLEIADALEFDPHEALRIARRAKR